MQQSAWIVTASYGAGAIAFAALSLLLLTNWRGRLLGATFAAATLINTAWLTLLALTPFLHKLPWQFILSGEAVRDGAWLFFLSRLLRSSRRGEWLQIVALLAPATWIIWAFSPTVFPPAALHVNMQASLTGGGLSLSIIGLVLLEQFCRNIAPQRRWALKFLCIGVGVQLGYDLLLYSLGLLYHHIDPAFWSARGAVIALTAPLMAVAAARNPTWSGGIFVSRRIVFHTAALLAAGAYLLVMSAGGYYIRYMGGNWGSFWQILFVFAAAIVLLILFTSGQVRARIKVFLIKHFHTYKYDYREEWNRLIHRLYHTEESVQSPYERVIHAIAEIVDSPGGALWVKRDSIGRYAPVARWNLNVPDSATEPLDGALVTFMHARHWIIDAGSYHVDTAQHGDLDLPSWLSALPNWWLVVPLIQEDALIAFVVLPRSRAPRNLSWEDRDLLKAVGQQLAAYLAQHEAGQSLSQARQFQAFNQLSTFLMHDLKNLIAQQSLMVKNAAKHKHNPTFVDDMIATIDDSVQRMTRLLAQLQSGRQEGNRLLVAVEDIAGQAVAQAADRTPRPHLEIAVRDTPSRVSADTHAFSMILQHVIRNAQDATAADGEVCVKITPEDERILIDVVDSGSGMSPEFVRERLFTPFDSTKSSRGMGIGAYQAQAFARQHGGDVEVESIPGKGTRFRIWLPRAKEPVHTAE
ncbi:MAG: PEP-CTERM system histidine kinase PrsK [Acidihalobacter sp.]|uniref:XrtA/PEP-CTERM system histidine kinase PrsK n=1 Tax=Acidihalobacter sp. TaxID=1872108 RepID=UPI00307E09D3